MRLPTNPTGGAMMAATQTPGYIPISQLIANGDFSYSSLIGCVNSVPFEPSWFGDQGLYEYQSETTNSVLLELDGQAINLVPASAPGTPGLDVGISDNTTYPVASTRLAQTFKVYASEVSGARQVGGINLDTVQTRADRKMQNAVRNLRTSIEYQRVKVAQGRLLDADGSVIVNYYTLLGLSEETISLDTGTTTTDMIGKATDILQKVEDGLGGLTDGIKVTAILGRDLWKAFITHPNVKDAYKYFEAQRANNPNREDLRYADFEHGGVFWRLYRGSTPAAGRFVADSEGRVIVDGAPGMYVGAFCPPRDIADFVNTPGLPMYMTVKNLDHNAGWEFRIQSNPVHILGRPKAAIKLTTS